MNQKKFVLLVCFLCVILFILSREMLLYEGSRHYGRELLMTNSMTWFLVISGCVLCVAVGIVICLFAAA